jgi:vancomycin resistance protein YoaR
MTKKKELFSKTVMTWSLTAGILILLLGGMVAFSLIGYAKLYENRIFPGVRVLQVRLDGLTESEARAAVHAAIDAALQDGLRFRYKDRDITLQSTTIATEDPDASRDLIRYDIDRAISAAMGYGRSNSLLRDTVLRWRARIKPVHLDPDISIDEVRIKKGIVSATKDIVPAVQHAEIHVAWNKGAGRADTTTTAERAGVELRLDIAMNELEEQSKSLWFAPIELHDATVEPSVRLAEVKELEDDVPAFLAHAPFTLTYGEDAYAVDPATLASWTGVRSTDGTLRLAIDPDLFHDGIRTLAQIEKTAKKGSLVIRDGRVESFEAGTEGVAIQDMATIEGIEAAWDSSSTFPIVTVREEPALAGADPERLGIREIVGIGTSNFSGSPTNRRKNIALGVKKVNGSLIAPGAEFSLLETLGGEFTAAEGWLPELVIKGNETIPEYGGGLCQIGTTTFRAALQSGMKITQRRNHSYRVRYYEPAGTDATIYDPSPDFRFVNDTKQHIYINAFITGDDVIYEFWGTDDGRKVTVGKPRIYNITSPPPKKLIETLDLPPGKTKCTESAHAGADAEFDYKIVYADGTVHEETFRSHYIPWQAVCLVGVEKLSDPVPTEGETATPAPTDATAPVPSTADAADLAGGLAQ